MLKKITFRQQGLAYSTQSVSPIGEAVWVMHQRPVSVLCYFNTHTTAKCLLAFESGRKWKAREDVLLDGDANAGDICHGHGKMYYLKLQCIRKSAAGAAGSIHDLPQLDINPQVETRFVFSRLPLEKKETSVRCARGAVPKLTRQDCCFPPSMSYVPLILSRIPQVIGKLKLHLVERRKSSVIAVIHCALTLGFLGWSSLR